MSSFTKTNSNSLSDAPQLAAGRFTNPKDREYKEMAEWYNDDTFDPKYFSVDEVNDFIQDPEEYEVVYRDYLKKTLRIQ